VYKWGIYAQKNHVAVISPQTFCGQVAQKLGVSTKHAEFGEDLLKWFFRFFEPLRRMGDKLDCNRTILGDIQSEKAEKR